MENREILSQKKFREINSLVTCLVKPLVSRNFCQKRMREFLKCPLCVHAYIHSMKNEDCISFLSFFNIFREVTFTHGRILGRSVDCEKVQKNREIDSFVTPLI